MRRLHIINLHVYNIFNAQFPFIRHSKEVDRVYTRPTNQIDKLLNTKPDAKLA